MIIQERMLITPFDESIFQITKLFSFLVWYLVHLPFTYCNLKNFIPFNHGIFSIVPFYQSYNKQSTFFFGFTNNFTSDKSLYNTRIITLHIIKAVFDNNWEFNCEDQKLKNIGPKTPNTLTLLLSVPFETFLREAIEM